MNTKNIKGFSGNWADYDPLLKEALMAAGRLGHIEAIDQITANLHKAYPEIQRDPGEGAGFVPYSERLMRAREML